MEFLKIVLLCVTAAVSYGIVHDQITARICVEYFTIAHPPVFQTESPTLLGLGWGIIATWWVGAILGVPLALAAQLGAKAKLSATQLRKPVFVLLACMAVFALTSGFAGWLLARNGGWKPPGDLADAIQPARHARFYADAFAHLASYGTGFLGGLLLIGTTLVRRLKSPETHSHAVTDD